MQISGLVPLKYIMKLAQVNPLVINYHVVSDIKLPHISNLYSYRSTTQFVQDLDFLVKNFNPLGLPEFLNSICNKNPLPKNSFLLTFDDGFREIYDTIVPILLSKNLSATFFLTSNFIDNRELGYDNKKSLLLEYLNQTESGSVLKLVNSIFEFKSNNINDIKNAILSIPYAKRFIVDKIASELGYSFDDYLKKQQPYLTSDQIIEVLKQGFTIGAHSIDHPRFSELALKDQVYQAVSSIKQVSSQFSLPYKVFAFPYSDQNVEIEFFTEISPYVEATFGTHGLLKDQVEGNFQRISVEKNNLSANKNIKFHLIRKTIYHKLGKDIILRS